MATTQEQTWGMLVHVITLVVTVTTSFGWLVGLIIYLLKKDESKFIAFHAMQAFLFQVVIWIGIVICALLVLPTLFLSLIPLFGMLLAAAIYLVIAALAANRGEMYELPIAGKWARNAVGI